MPTAKVTLSKGRTSPYTKIGIRRMQCSRVGCTNRAEAQWQACADGGKYKPICNDCDISLNKLVLIFMGYPDVEEKMKKYTGA